VIAKKSIETNVVVSEYIKEILSTQIQRIEIDKLSPIKQIAELKHRSDLVFDQIRKEYIVVEFFVVPMELKRVASHSMMGITENRYFHKV
jgi:hypothetical protein